MREEYMMVEDHEEWLAVAADADSGVYTLQGFTLHNWTKDKPVSEYTVAAAAVRELARRKGWDERLARVSGPLHAIRAVDPDVPPLHDRRVPSYVQDFRETGGWWLSVPADYLAQLDEPEHLSFEVEPPKRAVSLWAFEAYVKAYEPQQAIPEFWVTAEMALKDGALMMYNDHPMAVRRARKRTGEE